MAQGEHSSEKHRVQAYYLAKRKALMVLVAKHDNLTLTDSIYQNAVDRAKAIGIIDKDGNVLEDYKDELALQISLIEQ